MTSYSKDPVAAFEEARTRIQNCGKGEKYLNLIGLGLTTLPPEIGQLTALTLLQLQRNKLTTLPPEIGQLTALTHLLLFDNQLTTLPPEIGQLTALMQLYLMNNQLTTLPDGLRKLRQLVDLGLHDNPALELSPSVLGRHPQRLVAPAASPKSILDFYFSRRASSRPLNEVKLLLVGRGGAGKTSTVRALRGLPFQQAEPSTAGIALCDWTMSGCQGAPVTAHVWDFAGQVITHALHQFFFSERSLYVVVLTGRDNHEREDAEYWLRLIRAFGTDALGQGPPVIVALNQWDVPGRRPKLDRGAFQVRYPFIRGFVELDCQTNRGVDQLRDTLCHEVDQLHWVRDPFPGTWNQVRRALKHGGKHQTHLSYAEFRNVCTQHGVSDAEEQDSLAEVLHNLGVALNYRNDPRLHEATVLQPEWLTENVYALMRRAEDHAGVLEQSDVDAVLESVNDAPMRDYLMRIMERFEIAYTRPTNQGVWLVPQALPDEQPAGVESFGLADNATRLRYSYAALPEGLVARAIVRLHAFIEDAGETKQQWASGAILTRESARALIRTEPQDRQVMVTVTGPAKARQQLAGLCQAELREIHSEIPGLNPIEETQVQGVWVPTAILEADEKKQQQSGIWIPDRGTVLVDPTEFNNAYSEKASRSEADWKPSVFISYSKDDVNLRERLERELKILMNEGLLASHWHDRMIDPSDKWNDRIQSQLAEADVVILLVSTAALATDYITKYEIPQALALSESGKTVLVPVIVSDCRWTGTALRLLQVLPEKGKPLNEWKPLSKGWKNIADGLATVFEKLIQQGGRPDRPR